MIGFFRKIRKKFADNNRPLKYMRYAIGEIVLVMVGILLALQVNNWNEERKAFDKTTNLLGQVQKELLINIKTLNRTIEYYRDVDTLLYKILNKKLSYDDYKSRPKYFSVIMRVMTNQIVDDAFKNLIAFDGKFSIEQDSLVESLKTLYGPNKETLNKAYEMVFNSHLDFFKMLKKEKEWFYNFSSFREYTDDMINYYLTDPFYLNEVSEYEHAGLGNHFRRSLSFFIKSTSLYKKLSDQLKLEKDPSIIKDLKHYQHYIGNYAADSSYTLNITTEEDNLILKFRNNKDSTIVGNADLYPASKTYFTISNGTFGQLTYDENNEVNGFINSFGSRRDEYKKLNNEHQ